MSSIGFPETAEYEPAGPDAYDAYVTEREAALRAKGLPVPQHGVPEISREPLDMEALWRSLSEYDRERVGLLGLGIIVGGTIAAEAEVTAPAASRAGGAVYDACLHEIGPLDVPGPVLAALSGPSWRIPSTLGPVCLSCGCSENDACPGGCGWADEACTVCTECATPRPLPF